MDSREDRGAFTFERALLVLIAFGLLFLALDSIGRGRDVSRDAGDREGALREQVGGIDSLAAVRHQEVIRRLDRVETEVRLLALRVDEIDHGGPDAANRRAASPPQKEP